MVSNLSVVFIIINMLLGIGMPVALLVFFKKKYDLSVKGFFIGAGVMFFFALVLEQLVHSYVLGGKFGETLQSNIWAFAAYGGLMAGLFEETGRLVAMRFMMKDEHKKWQNSLMYGAGHGGFEVFSILTIAMINNILYAVMINSGNTETLMAPLSAENQVILQNAFDTLIATPSWMFLVAPIERIGAVAAQIGMSVIVWAAASATKIRWKYYGLAVLIHFLLDASTGVMGKAGWPIALIEVFIWIAAAIIVLVAKRTCNKEFSLNNN